MIESEKPSCDQAIDRECDANNEKSKEWYKVGENPCAILNPYFGNENAKYDKRENCANHSTHESTKNATKKSKKLIVRWCESYLKCYIIISLCHE